MVEAKNFVEKELGKGVDEESTTEKMPEKKEFVPTYTPPPPPIKEPLPPELQIIQQPVIQIVEKIIYKKQRIHGFFRTLTIIALLAIGFLMLGESTGTIQLSINSFQLHTIYPIIIILSTIIIRSYKGIFGKLFGLIIFLSVWGGMFTVSVYTSLNPSTKWKGGQTINYVVPTIQTGNKTKTNLYVQTLIGNSDIVGNGEATTIKGTRNSDRNLFVTSGKNTTIAYLKFNEDNNRNILQDHASSINLILPNNKMIDMLYVKNLFGFHTIDLATFQWKTCKFHAGIDGITIKIGNVLSGNKVEIQGPVANITLDIPRDIGVIMYYKHFVGMLKTPEFEALSGHYFQSQNLSGAKAILNIYISLGIGNTKINRIDPK